MHKKPRSTRKMLDGWRTDIASFTWLSIMIGTHHDQSLALCNASRFVVTCKQHLYLVAVVLLFVLASHIHRSYTQNSSKTLNKTKDKFTKVRARYTEDKYHVDPVASWAKIEEDRKALVALDKNFLLTQLYACKLEEHGTVASYVDALNAIVDNLRTCGKTVDDDDRWFYLTNGLPGSWSVFQRVVEGTAGSQKRNVETLITKMLAEEAQLKRDQGLGADSVLYAGKPGAGQGRGRPGISRRNEEQRDTVECFYCREKGHVKRECAKYAAVECFYCQRKGHMKRECQKYKEDKDNGTVESQGAPSDQGQSSIARVVEDKLWSVVALTLDVAGAVFPTGQAGPGRRKISLGWPRPLFRWPMKPVGPTGRPIGLTGVNHAKNKRNFGCVWPPVTTKAPRPT